MADTSEAAPDLDELIDEAASWMLTPARARELLDEAAREGMGISGEVFALAEFYSSRQLLRWRPYPSGCSRS